jgi:hypothetical protein
MVGSTGFGAAKNMTQGNKQGVPQGYMQGNKVPKGYDVGRMQQFTPEQMQLFQSLFSHLQPGSFTSKLAGGDQAGFEQMEAPAMKQFSSMMGGLGSKFAGMGSGAARSSGFQNTATQATSDFAQQLQSQRMGLQRQAIQDMMGMSGALLGQRPQAQGFFEKPLPFWQQLMGSAAGGASQAAALAMLI